MLKINIRGGGEGQFRVERNESRHKNSFFSKLNSFFESKYPNYMTCSHFQRETLWYHICNTRKSNRHAFMAILTHTKLRFSQLIVTINFGMQATATPPRPEKRLKRPGLIWLKVLYITLRVSDFTLRNFVFFLKSIVQPDETYNLSKLATMITYVYHFSAVVNFSSER